MKWYVEVVAQDSGKVVTSIGPIDSERSAERTERGVLINMNREFYVTRVVSR